MAEIFPSEFKTEGFLELNKQLESLMTSDPEMEKEIRKIIAGVLREARWHLSHSAQSGLRMNDDPRKAAKAVRSSVYKRILGGNVNILTRRKSGSPGPEPLPTSRVGRGGNRRKRSARTKQLLSYWGEDRGFILRFLNQGTQQRAIKMLESTPGRNGKVKTRWVSRPSLYGNRGQIQARPWFGDAAQSVLEMAVEQLREELEDLITKKTS